MGIVVLLRLETRQLMVVAAVDVESTLAVLSRVSCRVLLYGVDEILKLLQPQHETAGTLDPS